MTTPPGPNNPFPGLRPFDPDEDHLFFGRERATDELLRRLRRNRFLAVVGSSGSGKSSLVRTGLIPSLHSGFMVQAGSTWRVAIMRPGEDPIGNLASALDRPEILRTEGELADANRMMLEATLRRSPQGLADCVRYAGIAAHENVLVLVDQFEELFRFKSVSRHAGARDEAVAFVSLLLEAARQETVAVYVALTMRSDFIGDCMGFPGLPEAINRGQYLVPRMTRDELRQAITGPVAVGGGTISRRLVMRLLNDVGDDPDQLPILQHALMRTWDRWMADRSGDEPIDLQHYVAIGGLRQALSRHAEEAYAELPPPAGGAIAEKLFKALTDGKRGVRRPVRLSEVCALADAPAPEVREVVEVFRRPGRSFLTPPAERPLDGDPVIDLSHESLMRVWDRLVTWTRQEASSAESYLRLAEASRRHEAGTAGLWRDPELELGLQWRAESSPTAVWARRYDPSFDRAIHFLDDSKELRDSELAERELQRRRKLRRARWLAAILGSAALIVFVFGLAAMRARRAAVRSEQAAIAEQHRADKERHNAVAASREAEKQARLAESERDRAREKEEEARQQRQLADAARQDAEEQRDRAQREEEEAERERQLAEAARRDAEVQRDRARDKEEEADIERGIAEAARQDAVTERDRANRLWLLALARELAAKSGVVSDEGQREAVALLAVEVHQLFLDGGGPPDEPQIYDAARRALDGLTVAGARELRHPAGVRAVAVSGPQGQLATAGDDGLVWVYDSFASQRPRFELVGDPLGVRSLALSSDGRFVAAGGSDGSVRAWDLVERGNEIRFPQRHDGPVHALAFRPGDAVVASAGADGVWLRDLRRPDEPPVEPASADETAYDVAFDPGGEVLAAAGREGARLWRYRSLSEAPVHTCRALDLRAVAIAPDRKTVACGDSDGAIELSELDVVAAGALPGPGLLVEHRSAVTDLEFSPAGDQLASASLDNRVMLWTLPLPEGRPLPVVLPHEFWVWAVAFGPKGDRLYSASADRTVRVWESRTQGLVRQICQRAGRGLTSDEWEEYLASFPRRDSCSSFRE